MGRRRLDRWGDVKGLGAQSTKPFSFLPVCTTNCWGGQTLEPKRSFGAQKTSPKFLGRSHRTDSRLYSRKTSQNTLQRATANLNRSAIHSYQISSGRDVGSPTLDLCHALMGRNGWFRARIPMNLEDQAAFFRAKTLVPCAHTTK